MFYTSKLMAKHGVKAVFSDREGGCSEGVFSSLNLGVGLGDATKDVEQNLATLCQHAEVPLPHQCQQVHGQSVLWCEGVGENHTTEADILITCKPKVSLAVRTADCLPILLADMQSGMVAAVHAGWRGSVAQVVKGAIEEMCAKGANPQHILASLGPCIGACCFEVNQEIGEALSTSCCENVVQDIDGKSFADLLKSNYLQLLQAGLTAAHIECADICTFCHGEPGYFSYRRDCGKTGRQIAMITAP